MPNTFSYIALLCWPLVSFILFRRFSLLIATFWTIFGGALLLPVNVEFDFQGFPPIGKMMVSCVAAFLGCKFSGGQKVTWLPASKPEKYLVFLLLATPILTALTNGEPVYRGESLLPGLTLYNGIAGMVEMYIFVIPFILAVQLVKTYEDQVNLLKMIVIAGLWYSIPILIEIRLSPQLHTWIYGFFPHSFIQQKRFGGFRPVVFLGHGLVVAMFLVVVLASSVMLWKEKIKATRYSPFAVVVYLLVLLFLCKSVGPAILGILYFIFMGWSSIKVIKAFTILITVVIITYPLLCIYGIFPHELLVNLAEPLDASKSSSLAFRFYHENRLLDLAVQKPIFGWGVWGRHRLVDSVTDGYWVVIFGQYGIAGFLGIFGLIGYCVLKGLKAAALLYEKGDQKLLIGHALLAATILVDQIPNSSLSRGWMLFIIGALLGRANSTIKEFMNAATTRKV